MDQALPDKELRILLLEDVADDAELITHILRNAGISFVSTRVDTREAFVAALTEYRPDIVLSDYKLAGFDGRTALEIVRHDHAEVPVVMVTGTLGDEAAIELIKAGAKDYVLKDNLARLGHAVRRALNEEMGIRNRKAAERALRFTNVILTTQQETSLDGILVVGADSRVISCNQRFVELWDIPQELVAAGDATAMLQLAVSKLIDPAVFLARVKYLNEHPQEKSREELALRDGRILDRYSAPMFGADGTDYGRVWYFRDITERKRSEASLQRERDFSTAVVDTVASLVVVVDVEGRIVSFNKSCEACTGYTREEAIGRLVWDFLLLPEEIEKVKPVWDAVVATPQASRNVNHWATKAGAPRLIEWSNTVLLKPDGTLEYIIGTGVDITERARAERAMQRLNRALKTLSAGNEALIHAANEEALLHTVCRIVVEAGGYRMAWVGFAENDPDKTVRPVAHHGYEAGYLEDAQIVWSDTERGNGPTGIAIRTGVALHIQNLATDPRMQPWRTKALQFGYQSCISLPLRIESGVMGALTIYAAEPEFFDQEELALLQELADDLAFGLITLRTRAERDRGLLAQQQHQLQLRESLEDTIQAIAATVEMRDPYTAGHQRSVAQLCVAIARELGLAEERIHGLSLAATIHDLGKINIPAEILSKPGRLSPMEFALIKAHPQVGYDIIKDVRFPWPIAEMILQHHERLDGSGYPNGLRGEQLLLEAKILAVADVVEAMASYRPYRPGLGIDAALGEIVKHRGVLYDEATVDACLRLFHEQRFSFEKAS